MPATAANAVPNNVQLGVSGPTTPDSALKLTGQLPYVSTTTQLWGPQVFSLEVWFKTTTTNGGRLAGFESSQTGASVSFTYDADDRRGSLTLPNGIVLSYAYDADGRVAAQSWMAGLTQVGDLEYIYDADGRVIQKTGSLAQAQMPKAVSGNTFNAASEMLTFNGVPLSYDAAGNLLSDALNTYSWDLRNHLSGISGGSSASFVYDAFGRRAAKTINGTTTQFLYDRLNPVQELDGASPPNVTARMLTGRRIDEIFQRVDASGSRTLLTDMLGTTLGLTDASATIQTAYSYEPFGNVALSGAPSANSYQFTGRENDDTGFYFYRARYYSPGLQRFISQDPIGFAGGDPNLYAYVADNPTGARDSTGTIIGIDDAIVLGAIATVLGGAVVGWLHSNPCDSAGQQLSNAAVGAGLGALLAAGGAWLGPVAGISGEALTGGELGALLGALRSLCTS